MSECSENPEVKRLIELYFLDICEISRRKKREEQREHEARKSPERKERDRLYRLAYGRRPDIKEERKRKEERKKLKE